MGHDALLLRELGRCFPHGMDVGSGASKSSLHASEWSPNVPRSPCIRIRCSTRRDRGRNDRILIILLCYGAFHLALDPATHQAEGADTGGGDGAGVADLCAAAGKRLHMAELAGPTVIRGSATPLH